MQEEHGQEKEERQVGNVGSVLLCSADHINTSPILNSWVRSITLRQAFGQLLQKPYNKYLQEQKLMTYT